MENNLHEMIEQPAAVPVKEKKKKNAARIAVAAAVCLLAVTVMAVIGWALDVPAVRYCGARAQLAWGDYRQAREGFAQLGDFADAEEQLEEAEKGLRYLDAVELLSREMYAEAAAAFAELGDFRDAEDYLRESKYFCALELMEQGEYDAARVLLEEMRGYKDSSALLREIANEEWYLRAADCMERKDYLTAAGSFRALGDYKDARERAEECVWLNTAEKTYTEGRKYYNDGKWREAYRTLLPLLEADFKDTAKMIGEITASTEEYVRKYGEAGERGRALAFLQVLEEIDAAQAQRVREELFPAETFVPDNSFYIFDTTHIKGFTADTTVEEFAVVVVDMLLYGKMEFALMCNKTVDYDTLTNRALQACDLAGEILPGYGAIYNPRVSAGSNYVKFHMNVDEAYNEFQRTQHIKTFKQFCEDSVRELTELGLLGSNMSRRQKAEVIGNWVCFYLTYDQSLSIHDVGVAVEKKRGVCESYAALYNRMCNLAGIPTYGQIGDAAAGAATGRHIWSFHVDENGQIYYADMTWGDSYEIDFGAKAQEEEPTVALFAEYYLDRCMKAVLMGNSGGGISDPYRSVYFWSGKLWLTHEAERSCEQIIAYHNRLTGKAA